MYSAKDTTILIVVVVVAAADDDDDDDDDDVMMMMMIIPAVSLVVLLVLTFPYLHLCEQFLCLQQELPAMTDEQACHRFGDGFRSGSRLLKVLKGAI